MIHFLTYHKVVAPSDGDTDFYTVTCAQLRQQLQALADAGFTPGQLERPEDWKKISGKQFALSFDDGTADHFEVVLPVLKQFNLRGLFFIPTARMNRPGRLTDAQVRQMAAAGHVIGCHGHEHQRLDTLSETDMRHQLRKSRDTLVQIAGVPIRAFAPPGGFINSNIRATALDLGLDVIRTMRWGFNAQLDFTALETIPINRHTDARRFSKILEGKQPRLLYFAKQAAKTLVPARTYERMRGWIFKLGRGQ